MLLIVRARGVRRTLVASVKIGGDEVACGLRSLVTHTPDERMRLTAISMSSSAAVEGLRPDQMQ